MRTRLLGRWRPGRRLARAPRPTHQLTSAVRTDAVQRVRAGRAKSAFVAADVGRIVVGGERPRAALAAFPHLQSHWVIPYLVSLKSSRPISIRRISEVPAPIS